jgi:hypothetical protein
MNPLDERQHAPPRAELTLASIRNRSNARGADSEPVNPSESLSKVVDRREPAKMPRSPEVRSVQVGARARRTTGLIRNLEWLRAWTLDRLDSIEALARRQLAVAPGAGEIAALEDALKQRVAELEEAERQLRCRFEQEERERDALLAQLEADRGLLAEAWESVERERIAYVSAPPVNPHLHAHVQAHHRGAVAAHPPAVAAAATLTATKNAEANNPVAQAILRQFQTLSSDVRRHAERRNDACARRK